MPIHCTELRPGFPVFEIDHPAVTARISRHGAHLMEWTPAGQAAGLYLSPESLYQTGKAIRGGIPVCWPWFGPSRVDPTLPAHGFARTRAWEPGEFTEHETGVRLIFTLQDSEDTRRLWPHPFHLELTMELGASLQVSLRMSNPGDTPFTVTGALHTYLAIGDIHQTQISGLDGVSYLDTVGPEAGRTQAGGVIFDGEVDRIYHTAVPITLHDAAQDRNFIITGTGSQSSVVWNPWTDKARALTDLPDADFACFVCVETANAREDAITIPPGGHHVLATGIRLQPPPGLTRPGPGHLP